MRVAAAIAAVSSSALLTGLVTGAAAAGPAVVRAAAPATPAVAIQPDIVHLHGALHGPPSTAFCERNFKIACYTAKQIQRAFNLGPLYAHGTTGKGETIVIVDSYGSPTVAHDLAVFDKGSHLPAPPKLTIIQPAGKVPRYRQNDNREGWAGETDLDVEYAHAIAPGAKILLVETPTSENEGSTGFPAIVKAEKYVVNHHLGGVISQSFSATEESFANAQPAAAAAWRLHRRRPEGRQRARRLRGQRRGGRRSTTRSTYFLHPVTSWPDSDPLVTGIGGTQLHLNAAGRRRRPADGVERHLQQADAGVHHRQQPGHAAGRRRRQVGRLRPPVLARRRRQRRGQQPRACRTSR